MKTTKLMPFPNLFLVKLRFVQFKIMLIFWQHLNQKFAVDLRLVEVSLESHHELKAAEGYVFLSSLRFLSLGLYHSDVSL